MSRCFPPTSTWCDTPRGDGEKIAAIRAYKYVEIFDELYDQGYTVLEIKRGFGRIKPKLYNSKIHEASL